MVNIKNQHGLALMVSLIMLLLMSLLAINSMKSTVLEEKITANYKNRNMAFQAAEAGLRAGEEFLAGPGNLPIFDGNLGRYQATTSGSPRWESIDWYDSSKTANYTGLSYIASQPLYIIEELPSVRQAGESVGSGLEENSFYRVTTHAVGGTKSAEVILQSTFKR
ncbi:MAG: pilus assembly protein PilX [Gammaproteobacteria bacterium]|nr:MAG: pilus assembly protein PilX [Gammaproteobacteria bacterium]